MRKIHAIIGKEIKECERLRCSTWIHPTVYDNILEKIISLFPPTKDLEIEGRTGYTAYRGFTGAQLRLKNYVNCFLCYNKTLQDTLSQCSQERSIITCSRIVSEPIVKNLLEEYYEYYKSNNSANV
jgi:hypothetical protein